jgi:hypothetical protein
VPDQFTLDVIDRPAGGVIAGLKRLGAIRDGGTADLRALIRLGTGHFVPRTIPAPTPRRIGVLAAWRDGADVDARWAEALGGVTAAAREHWHVRGEVTRAAFSEPWQGWTPDVGGARALDDEEPALIVIAGNLHARYVPAFMVDAGRAIGHAFAQPGYLGGLAIQSSPLNTTSCSAWRHYRDAKAYAYQPGGHADAMRRDRANGHHRTEWFLRLRPLAERGSLAGAAPFAAVGLSPSPPLPSRRVAAAGTP